MTRDALREQIVETGIVPSVRTATAADARFAAETLASAGIPVVEITMTVPHALEIIAELSKLMPAVIIGAGTVFDVATARRAIEAGARFVTSPGLDQRLVTFAQSEGVLAIPGALTPTEVTAAWQAGADFVKVFPCAPFGGAGYIHALKGPFPDVPFVAAGGVNQQTAAEFITAGAAAIGVGAELVPKKAVQHRDAQWIKELARRFLTIIHEARGRTTSRDETFDRR